MGEFLYLVGFWVEYRFVCLWRGGTALFRCFVSPLTLLRQPHFSLRRPFHFSLRGWAAPSAAGCFLALLVTATLRLPFVLQVEVNGVTVGCVRSEQEFDAAREDIQRRIASAELAESWDLWPTFTLQPGRATMTEAEIANAIMRAAGDEICEATAVTIDGSLRFVTDEGEHLRRYLAQRKAACLTAPDPNARVEFVHQVRLTDGVYLADSVCPYPEVLADPSLFAVKRIVRSSYTEEIPFPTSEFDSAEYPLGSRVTVQPGETGLRQITSETTWIDGQATETAVVGIETLRDPTEQRIARGLLMPDGRVGRVGTGHYLWPVPGYRRVERWRNAQHRGADIVANYGTPILAADSGIVEIAEFHHHPQSWGNYVVIDHNNGSKTLYGHMSAFAVRAGDVVNQGDVIGYVGNTGYSFGNHCHFEMWGPDGRLQNPQDYFNGY